MMRLQDFHKKLTMLIIAGVWIFLSIEGGVLPSRVLASDHNDNALRKGPYLIYQGKNTEMKILWQRRSSRGTIEITTGE